MTVHRIIGSIADLDVNGGTSPYTSTTSSSFIDVNVAIEGLLSANGSFGRVNLATPLSDFWFNVRIALVSIGGAGGESWIQFFATSFSTTQALFRVRRAAASNTDGGVQASYWNGSAWVNIGTGPQYTASKAEETLRIKLHGSSGIFRRYKDTVLDGELTGNTIFTAGTAIDRIEFTGSASLNQTALSEIIIADEDTRGWRLQKLSVSANGANTAWTNDYTAVDETGIDDSDYISSGTANQVETYVVGDIHSSISTYDVKALAFAARARRGGSGPQNMQAGVRTGGANFFSSNLAGMNTAFKPTQYVWDTNPDTAASWTQTDVNGAEVGVKSIA